MTNYEMKEYRGAIVECKECGEKTKTGTYYLKWRKHTEDTGYPVPNEYYCEECAKKKQVKDAL